MQFITTSKVLLIAFFFTLFALLFTINPYAQQQSTLSLDLNGGNFQVGQERVVEVIYTGESILAAEIHVNFGSNFTVENIVPGDGLVSILMRRENGEIHVGKLTGGWIDSGDVLARYYVKANRACSNGTIYFNQNEIVVAGQDNVSFINSNYQIDCSVLIYGPDSSLAYPCMGRFSDLTQNSAVCTSAEYLNSRGIVNGYNDGSYRASEPMTKGQLAKVLYKSFNIPANTAGTQYSDVSASNIFFLPVMSLRNQGTFNEGATFGVDQKVEAIDMFVILHSYLQSRPEIMAESGKSLNDLLPLFQNSDIDYQRFNRGDVSIVLAAFLANFGV